MKLDDYYLIYDVRGDAQKSREYIKVRVYSTEELKRLVKRRKMESVQDYYGAQLIVFRLTQLLANKKRCGDAMFLVNANYCREVGVFTNGRNFIVAVPIFEGREVKKTLIQLLEFV
ncbi:hypothetical protein [Thermococcus alcaliphilus]|uniref:hypothetical protein n=1 Tax=Thermococcus alcaliphilus TaxID=139207 RepID=UPI002090F84E|nr:hypothetical protein [Thermococcus alcaliphilus]MCO6041857.1 hypothetical protein [Thermococcus alcaliphilus]